jgi:hypothetical protein
MRVQTVAKPSILGNQVIPIVNLSSGMTAELNEY